MNAMNVMTDQWTVFGQDRGQIVEEAFRYDADRDEIVMRVIDRSDGEAAYYSAPCPEEVEWWGAESYRPWGREVDAILRIRGRIVNPFGD